MVKLTSLLLLLLSELLLPLYRTVLLKDMVQLSQINMNTPAGEATNNGFVKSVLISAGDKTPGAKEARTMHSQAGLYVTAFCGIAR